MITLKTSILISLRESSHYIYDQSEIGSYSLIHAVALSCKNADDLNINI